MGGDDRATLAHLKDLVRQLSYKPQHTFIIERETKTGNVAAMILAQLPDASNPDKMIQVYRPFVGPWEMVTQMGPMQFVKFIAEALVSELEEHEKDEWLKFGGARLTEPSHGSSL